MLFLEGKKKGRGVITPSASALPLHQQHEKILLARKLYHKF
jgi:hypothetical protein